MQGIGNPKGPIELGLDEITLVAKALQAVNPCEYGGVEGGVSNSSDDVKESAHEEVSETREGVRETVECDVLCPEGTACIDGRLCDAVVCGWDATLRGRGRGSLFLGSETTGFDPRISVPVVNCTCEGSPF